MTMSDIVVRDTVSPDHMTIDTCYHAVLAYRDGRYRWPASQVQRFLAAGKSVYPVTVFGGPHLAQIADCERGDLTPDGAARFASERNQLHHDATIYVSLSGIRDVVDALGCEPAWLWVADWTGTAHTPAVRLPAHVKIAAVQYSNGELYDTSAILSSVWPAHPWKAEEASW